MSKNGPTPLNAAQKPFFKHTLGGSGRIFALVDSGPSSSREAKDQVAGPGQGTAVSMQTACYQPRAIANRMCMFQLITDMCLRYS